jgi:hypothetical protein
MHFSTRFLKNHRTHKEQIRCDKNCEQTSLDHVFLHETIPGFSGQPTPEGSKIRAREPGKHSP